MGNLDDRLYRNAIAGIKQFAKLKGVHISDEVADGILNKCVSFLEDVILNGESEEHPKGLMGESK